jgi:hypothetical protein
MTIQGDEQHMNLAHPSTYQLFLPELLFADTTPRTPSTECLLWFLPLDLVTRKRDQQEQPQSLREHQLQQLMELCSSDLQQSFAAI